MGDFIPYVLEKKDISCFERSKGSSRTDAQSVRKNHLLPLMGYRQQS